MGERIGIIGYGSMGKMIATKMLEKGVVSEEDLFVSNRTIEKISALKEKYPKITMCSNVDSAKCANLIFLCVRPIDMKAVLEEIKEYVTDDKCVISLNGSIRFKQLERVIRGKLSKAIPSITAEVNESQTLVCHNDKVTKEDKETLEKLLSCFGYVIELPEEEMGMGSELVSCMPGFLAAIVKVITDSAQRHTEIEAKEITRMIFETMYGTSKLVREQNVAIEELIERVATKGGITEEGTKVIEEKFSLIADEMFEKTLQKRRLISEAAESSFAK